MKRTHTLLSVSVAALSSLVIITALVLFNVARIPASAIQPDKLPTPTPTLPASPQITVDFGSRQNLSHPIPANFFGFNGGDFLDTIDQASSGLHQANFKMMRVFIDIDEIFPTVSSATNPSQQSWLYFDQQMTRIGSEGFQPILSLIGAPTWMQPQNQKPASQNYCLTSNDPRAHHFPSHVLPTYIVNGVDKGPAMWASLAALVVAHMDKNFPAILTKYEVWNEPDGVRFLCVANNDPNPETTRYNEYHTIFKNTAPALRAQAQHDNQQIKIGAPALAYVKGHGVQWVPLLVNDASIYPYLDFVSYHMYFGNPSSTWDTGIDNFVKLMQIQRGNPIEGYELVSSGVHAGKQPNATKTPVYIDEFGTFDGTQGCCHYDPVFGPLWANLFIADMLNTVNDTGSQYGPASAVPGAMLYYALSDAGNGFCLYGQTTTLPLNCNIGPNIKLKPYPPYYALQLLGSSSYLDIMNGMYVATATSTNAPNVVITAFFSGTRETVLIVNMSKHTFTSFPVKMQNTGTLQKTATVYTLAKAPQITSQQTGLSTNGSGYQTAVTVPGYSTVAISMTV